MMSDYEPTPADDPAVGLSFLEKLVLAIIDATHKGRYARI